MTTRKSGEGAGDRRLATSRQLPELLRDLSSDDFDARDEATEEIGRRLRGEAGNRIAAYLQAAGVPKDRDAADRLARLTEIRDSLERADSRARQLRELRSRTRMLKRRIDAWERYQEDADPGTSTGTWVVENLAAIDRLLGLFRARIEELDAAFERLTETAAAEQAMLDEMPGADAASSQE